ncbi:MAG TPA: alpha/beta hydrolase fold domain-containing protein [Streptosporangiaceae bacterium]
MGPRARQAAIGADPRPPARRGVRGLVLTVALVVLFAVAPETSHATVAHEQTYAYGSHVRQALDAYWNDPADGAAQPGIVIVHGGYWNSGDKAEWKGTAEWYAGQGFAVFSINYRYDAEAFWPGPRDDVLAAVEWIKTHAADFRLDPDRIAMIGSQGGGQLAAQAGTLGTGNARVRGVVALSGIMTPKRAYDEAQTTAATASRRKVRDHTVVLAGCTIAVGDQACLTRYTDMSVAAQASGDDAPMLLIHSSSDIVPATHATDVKTALAAQGVADVTVRTVSSTSSGGGGLLNDTAVRDQTLAWLRAHTQPRPTAPAATVLNPTVRARTVDSTSDDTGTTGTTGGTAATPAPDAPRGAAPLAATATRTEETYSYGGNARQTLDAYYYKGTTKRYALILVHGGYWYEGDKAEWAAHARWFADRGYAVFSVNYRLNTDSAWSAQRTDMVGVVAWLRANAAKFPINPDHIVVLGASAGGHLASSIGTWGAGKGRVRAFAALSPVANPYRAYNDGQTSSATAKQRKLRDTAVLLARCTPYKSDAACWKRWVDIVTFNHLTTTDAPAYLVHSAGDFVPAAHSTELCARMKAKKLSCTAVTVSGSAHGIDLLKVSGVRTKVLDWLEAHD